MAKSKHKSKSHPKGLRTKDAYQTILREGMSTDTCDLAGVYFGTETGQLFYTRDQGNQWQLLDGNLPRIMSVQAAAI